MPKHQAVLGDAVKDTPSFLIRNDTDCFGIRPVICPKAAIFTMKSKHPLNGED
ncbi:hypothetical protein JOD43_000115 [Pullulanibacillus pueri]|uniref:hypothetical protein n=1 Tax=Pullulanibacillus pueri TaxID=1437324 RepID=UPI001667DAE6|nr:hypothetical protein [Pullulanibacillus pueri]MBM7679956.1 hypothetical protein [Pullulanibacillus pueri]